MCVEGAGFKCCGEGERETEERRKRENDLQMDRVRRAATSTLPSVFYLYMLFLSHSSLIFTLGKAEPQAELVSEGRMRKKVEVASGRSEE